MFSSTQKNLREFCERILKLLTAEFAKNSRGERRERRRTCGLSGMLKAHLRHGSLFDEHAVSVGIEAVGLGDCVVVCLQNVFFSGEGAD